MKTVECKSCKESVSAQAAACPTCGHPTLKEAKEWFGGLALLIALAVAVAIYNALK